MILIIFKLIFDNKFFIFTVLLYEVFPGPQPVNKNVKMIYDTSFLQLIVISIFLPETSSSVFVIHNCSSFLFSKFPLYYSPLFEMFICNFIKLLFVYLFLLIVLMQKLYYLVLSIIFNSYTYLFLIFFYRPYFFHVSSSFSVENFNFGSTVSLFFISIIFGSLLSAMQFILIPC